MFFFGMLDGDGTALGQSFTGARRVIFHGGREGRKPEPATHAWPEPSERRKLKYLS